MIAALFASACSGAKQEPAAAAPPPAVDAGATDAGEEAAQPSRESKAVLRTLARVSELRGLHAARPIPGITLERGELVARVKDKALTEYPPEALRREGQVLQLLGFAPTSFDYLGEMMKLLEAQLEGFYEPKNGTMYLAADLRGKTAQATLAHELVHALQDHAFDLTKRTGYRPGKSDENFAFACLAEGDATSVMMDFIMREQGQTALDLPEDTLRGLMAAGIEGPSIASVPRVLRTTLIAPYVDGLLFTHALRRKGGWAMVNRAWEKPPLTTEHVLHVDKWEVYEPAIPIQAPSARALGDGWKLDDEDTVGELAFALMFEEWVGAEDAREAATGWGGDRSAVYTKGDEIAYAVRLRYDEASPKPSAFADRAFAKVAPGLKKIHGKPAIDTADALCFERGELGPLLVARRARDLAITAGAARVSEAAWTSTSTCAAAKRWADEILASP